MIFEFLLPILGWLVFFGFCFIVYSAIVYKNHPPKADLPGQALYTALATFFWLTVYMCLSSVWSILYSLIDLKYPDAVAAASNYGTSGFSGVGVVYDAFAFPLALVVVSSVTALVLAFWLISKFEKNKDLRPERLYLFMRALVFLGGAIMIFSGFVYVVYSWLYGNLPVAVFMKGAVALVIVGMVALYFYLTADGKNPREGAISRFFASMLVVVTVGTLWFSFSVIGTPAQARMYRLDSITLQNLQTIKNEIDSQDQSFGKRINSLSEVTNEYVKGAIKRSPSITYTTDNAGNTYTLCGTFNASMPQTINMENRDTTWDYHAGNSCFTFPHLPTYATVQAQPYPTKPIYNQ
jgi:hypothetical protein